MQLAQKGKLKNCFFSPVCWFFCAENNSNNTKCILLVVVIFSPPGAKKKNGTKNIGKNFLIGVLLNYKPDFHRQYLGF